MYASGFWREGIQIRRAILTVAALGIASAETLAPSNYHSVNGILVSARDQRQPSPNSTGSGACARGGRPGSGTELGGENRHAYLADK